MRFLFCVLALAAGLVDLALAHSTPARLNTRGVTTVTSKRQKKGLGINSLSDATAFGTHVQWAYGWSPLPPSGKTSLPNGVHWTPMLWGGRPDDIRYWKQAAEAAIKAGATYILGMNEPDLGSQSNMSPARAASVWRANIEPLLKAHPHVKACSPAVTNGGGPNMGVAWIKSFLRECKGCHVTCIAMHHYAGATDIAYFKSYFITAQKSFDGRPIWITEFMGAGSNDQKITYLRTVVPWLRSQKGIQRFAAFGLDPAARFVVNGQLTTLGRAYQDA